MDWRAAWLAWSLAVLSMALLVGGIALSRAASSTAPDLQFGGETDDSSAVIDLVTLLTFSLVGAIIASRHPRNTIGTIPWSVPLSIVIISVSLQGLAAPLAASEGLWAEYELSWCR